MTPCVFARNISDRLGFVAGMKNIKGINRLFIPGSFTKLNLKNILLTIGLCRPY